MGSYFSRVNNFDGRSADQGCEHLLDHHIHPSMQNNPQTKSDRLLAEYQAALTGNTAGDDNESDDD